MILKKHFIVKRLPRIYLCLRGLLPLIFIIRESFFSSHSKTPVEAANSFAPRVNVPGQITAAYSQP